MNRAYFITGTDTEVGKTQVTLALTRGFHRAGHSICAFKPMETDCRPVGDAYAPGPDARALAQAARQDVSRASYVCLPHPMAPSESARLAGVDLDIEGVKGAIQDRCEGVDYTLVEGAGGIMVPIKDRYLYLDLMAELAMPVILVAANRLGCLNHTLLSVRVLEGAGIPIAGVVLNGVDDGQSASQKTNFQVLKDQLPHITLAKMPFLGAKAAESAFDGAGEALIQALNLKA